MDIISHGLWGGVAFGRKNRRAYWTSFGFGIMPDLLSFGIFSAMTVLGLSSGPNWNGPHAQAAAMIPTYVYELYDVTHSLLVFGGVFGLVWLLRRRPFWPLAAWGLHILVDIPTHSTEFFPTPFLWPLSSFKVNGANWGQPIIFFPDVALLVLAYALWWYYKKKKK